VSPASALALLLLGSPLAAQDAAEESAGIRAGDYAGWAYLRSGGDLPLRWRCTAAGAGPAITVSLPHQRSFDLAADCAVTPAGAVTVAVRTRGAGLSFEGALHGDEVRGTLRFGDEDGTFELVRSSVPLVAVRSGVAGAEGVYRSEEGELLLLSAWSWGELRLLDLSSGADRTLFASDEEEFVAGPACGLPAPLQARFHLARAAGGAVEALERSGPDGSSPHEYVRVPLREEEIDFPSGAAVLRGTLLAPAGEGRRPVLVILGGSDVTLRQHVQATARIYAAFGFAAFAYDLRGHGQSSGERDCTLEQSADDACAAIRMLRERADVDPDHVGLAGTSRGGWTAPLAASRCPVSFLVLFVAPAVSPRRQLTRYWLDSFRAAGHGDEETSLAAAYLELVWRRTRSDSDWGRTSARARPWRKRAGSRSSAGPRRATPRSTTGSGSTRSTTRCRPSSARRVRSSRCSGSTTASSTRPRTARSWRPRSRARATRTRPSE
jgi:pimeloyl-ACP methyl ester carboxylesterase